MKKHIRQKNKTIHTKQTGDNVFPPLIEADYHAVGRLIYLHIQNRILEKALRQALRNDSNDPPPHDRSPHNFEPGVSTLDIWLCN